MFRLIGKVLDKVPEGPVEFYPNVWCTDFCYRSLEDRFGETEIGSLGSYVVNYPEHGDLIEVGLPYWTVVFPPKGISSKGFASKVVYYHEPEWLERLVLVVDDRQAVIDLSEVATEHAKLMRVLTELLKAFSKKSGFWL